MASSSFTFVNTTDGPSLSRSAAKKMRAHITKTNFEKRRQRLRQDTSGKLESHRAAPKNHNRASASRAALGDSYRMMFMKTMLEPLPKDTPPESFGRFWSLAFLDGGNFPQTDNEKAWAQLICSEPSLLQTTLAIGVRHWAPDAEYQQVADECWSAATNIMIQHISSGKPCTDAVLGTVITMAFGERLVQNDAAWEVHIDGLAKMISYRFEHGERTLPSWLYDLIISDATNAVLGFPRSFHPKVIEAVLPYDPHPLSEIASACDDLVEVLQTIDRVQRASPGEISGSMEAETASRVEHVIQQARALRAHKQDSVQITAAAIELMLHLSWPREPAVDCTAVAEEMRQALDRVQMRPCSYMELTAGYLMIGSVASEDGSETKQYFTSRLRRALGAVQNHSSINMQEVLKSSFVSSAGTMLCPETLWNEIIV